MALGSIMWVLIVAWLIALIFYSFQLLQLYKRQGSSDRTRKKAGSTYQYQLRRLLWRILISTLIFVCCSLAAWFLSRLA
ncbi:MAG: hypothetical protein BGO54_11570 [Sphingobacteriales bacterium 46-32]|nr:MAG: hypothetical protein BGO54_11570 [Sphingobacteriales bacterium 46-32]